MRRNIPILAILGALRGIANSDLLARLESAARENDDANALCRLAGLAVSGNAAQKRQRLASLVSGPVSRQRLGWLM